MGEIVRVLKWRLDLDSAGMAEGVEKAATSAERLAKAAAEVGEKGTAGLKKTTAAAKETDAAFEDLAFEAQQVERYVRVLEKGTGSPLAVERNAVMAEAAFNALSQSAQKAGKAIPEAFSDRVINAIGKATSSAAVLNAEIQKLGGLPPTKLDNVANALKKTQQSTEAASVALKDAALRSQEMASGMGLLASAGGPAGMALASVASQGSKVGNEMVIMAGKIAILGAAAKAGWESGQKLDESLKKMGVDLAEPVTALEKLSAAMNKTPEAAKNADFSIKGFLTGTYQMERALGQLPPRFKEVANGLIDMARESRDAGTHATRLAADIDIESQNLTEHTKALLANIVARRANRTATEQADAGIKEAIKGWESAADQQRKLSDEIEKAAAKFRDLGKNNQDWRKEVAANQEPLAAFVKKLEDKKVALDSLPAPLQEAIKYLKELEAAAKGAGEAADGITKLKDAIDSIGKTGAAESIDAVAIALNQIKAEGGNVGETVEKNFGSFQKLRDESEKNYESLQKFRTEVMDQIPAYQATALASAGLTEEVEKQIQAFEKYEAARRKANEADIEASVQMARFREEATQAAYAIDTIGESWVRATGHAAGFTVEVRHATKAVQETTPQFDALIESLALVSDEFPRMTPYVGALIAQLEKGQISTEEFGKAIDALRAGFMQIQGVSGQMFGPIETLFNQLRGLVNDFTYGEKFGGKK